MATGAASGPAQVADPPGVTVFIGGVGPGYALLADPAASAELLRTARIGLYQHANGNVRLMPAEAM